MPLYTTAKIEFQGLMAAESLDPVRALDEFERLDNSNVDRFGFSRQRLPASMLETYCRLSRESGRAPGQQVEKRISEIADRLFASKARLVPGAEDVLRALKDFRLMLLTKGDRVVQQRRLEESGLGGYFESIHIVPNKQEAAFQTLIKENGIDKQISWSVGDSLRSDVQPALKVGLNAIWIPASTWSYEVGSVRSDKGGLYICEALTGVPLILKRP